MLSPVFQQPLRQGADLVVASLTRYIGGHSDLISGAVVGAHVLLRPIRLLRSAIGTQLDPHSCWMVGRSLETLAVRVRAAASHAEAVIHAMDAHPKVVSVHALGWDGGSQAMRRIYAAQCTGPGSTFAIEIAGGQAEAFRVLNRLRLFKLAVSLGGTESLACHPASTTHFGGAGRSSRPDRCHRRADPAQHRVGEPGRPGGRPNAGAGGAGRGSKPRHLMQRVEPDWSWWSRGPMPDLLPTACSAE